VTKNAYFHGTNGPKIIFNYSLKTSGNQQKCPKNGSFFVYPAGNPFINLKNKSSNQIPQYFIKGNWTCKKHLH